MKIRLLDLAERDLADGARFYQRQQAGLGDYFLDSLFSDIDGLLLYAGVHGKRFGLFRALSRRFPFAIYDQVVGEEIRVCAVLDCRRDPKWIASQLAPRPQARLH